MTPMTFQEMREWMSSGAATPDWFSDGTTAVKAQLANVRRGLHPFGMPLSDNLDARCGNCANCIAVKYHDRQYHKCNLTPWTHGPGSDVRLQWHGCEKWAELP